MTTYIQELASDLLRRFGNDLSNVAIVFPNKRASLFLNDELARLSPEEPIWSPAYTTISDLFRQNSTLEVADPILLICRLYNTYTRITGYVGESLDHFYSWGQLMLADFDDLDKNMADADKVFTLVRDTHELDSAEYLDDEQRAVLKRFFETFTDDQHSRMKDKFLHLWSKLGDIYHEYRHALREEGIAYEGMLYRDVAEDNHLSLPYSVYCFVGFNMLQQVEQTLFRKLKNQGKALFYWDYDTYYVKRHHEAGHYIGEYLGIFPDALENKKDNFINTKRDTGICYVSSTTDTSQARMVYDWLLENDRWKAGSRTAIIMCDENMLPTIIHSLPKEITKVNITSGYPLQQSPVTTLVHHLFEFYCYGRYPGTDRIRPRYEENLVTHPFIAQLLPTDDAFRELLTADAEDVLVWIQSVIRYVATTSTHDIFDREALFRTHQILQRVIDLRNEGGLSVDTITLRRIIRQIMSGTSIPFHGEPIEGIQVMGVLETRCLDFDHILVLSANEGNMPKGVNDTSFIPHSVRKAYGLTTVENKVGIYSYYFHRLLQRASDVTIAYNSATEGVSTGEMSRFMLQIMVESGLRITQKTIHTGIATSTSEPQRVEKTPEIMEKLDSLFSSSTISPSSLSKFLRCPLSYYYKYICGLNEPDDTDEETVDNRVFGNIFHCSAEYIYKDISLHDGTVTPEAIAKLMKDPSRLTRYVDKAFAEQKSQYFNHTQPTGLQLITRKVIVDLLKDMLAFDLQSAPFTIISTEQRVRTTITIPSSHTVAVGGMIDRLDCIGDTVRVIDYKTGASEPGKMASIADIFAPKNVNKHSDYYLQALLYSIILADPESSLPTYCSKKISPSLLYVQKAHREGYSPVLSINDVPITDIHPHIDEYKEQLVALLTEILNPDIPFLPTDTPRHCDSCPYKGIC